VIEVKPGVAHGGQGIIDGRLGGALLGDLLVGVLDGAGAGLLQGFCTRQLAVRETDTRAGAFELSRGLAELDLLGGLIDQEQQIAIVYDIAVLEADPGQSPTDLGAQVDLLNGRKLAEKFEPTVHLTLNRNADADTRWRRDRGLVDGWRQDV
jgi:hypothetical protein